MKKTLILLSLMTSSFAMSQELVDIETKKTKIQNAFDSVSLDIQQDSLCLDKFTQCMDNVCNNSKVSRCVCASYFESSILSKRKKLMSLQSQTITILETEIPTLRDKKVDTLQTSIWGDTDVDLDMTYSSATTNLFGNQTGEFIETGSKLFNKGLTNCEKVAKSCASSSSTKIVDGYKTRINLTCNEYLDHLNKQEETISYDNIQALKIKSSYKSIAIGGTYNILTCTNKLKEFYIRECKGFDYKNCIKCKDVNSSSSCKAEIKKNFEGKKDTAYAELGLNCGKSNFEKSFTDLLSEVNGNFSTNLRYAQKSSDTTLDNEIKDYTDKITTCVTEVCGLTFDDCKTQAQIDTIMQSKCTRHLQNLEERFTDNEGVVAEVKAKVQININKASKLRGIDLNKSTEKTSLYN